MEQQEKITSIKNILISKDINFNEKTEMLSGLFTDADIPIHSRLDKQHDYTGLNPFALEVSKFENGFKSNLWATFNQAIELGYMVKKGSKGTPISVALINNAKDEAGEIKKDKNGEPIKKIRFKGAYVFNLDQLEKMSPETSDIQKAKLEAKKQRWEENKTEKKSHTFNEKYPVVA